jgi:hypothetical protein
VDLVHETVNRATLRSTVDPRTERGRSSPECEHAGVPRARDLIVAAWGSKRSEWGSLPRVARVGGGARTAGHRRREAAAEQARRGGARGTRVRRGGGNGHGDDGWGCGALL